MKYLDFDRMISEPTMVCIKAFREEIRIPDRIPALLVLELMQYDDGEPVPADALVRAAVQLFGDERVERWLKRDGISLDELGRLLKEALVLLGGGVPGGEPLTEDGVDRERKN